MGNGVNVKQMVQGKPLPLAFDTLNLNAELNNGRAQADWLIKLANNGQFNGQVQIADPQGRRNLSGNVAISQISLAMINPILSDGEKAKGILNANLRLGGMPGIRWYLVDWRWMASILMVVGCRWILPMDV